MYNQKKIREASWKRELPVYKEFQKGIEKEKLNKYGFDVTLANPRERRLKMNHMNTGSGFETASIEFKGTWMARVIPFVVSSTGGVYVRTLYLTNLNWETTINHINYSLSRRKLPDVGFKREHKTLQSCINELERVRKIIVKYFSK